jgi:hypothetical protein
MITGYVLNEDHTKLLMCYDENLEQWLPTGGTLASGQVPQTIILQYVLDGAGLVAHHVAEYDEDESALKSYILEADEQAVSKVELEEHYNAQWLTKDQILSCTCIHVPAKGFAAAILI